MVDGLSPSVIGVSQINARSYSNGSASSTSNVFQDVGHVSNSVNIQVNAGIYNEAHQASSSKGTKGKLPLRVPASMLTYLCTVLSKNIAVAAIHNSSERGDAPKCHEGTRVAILENITQWINDSGENTQKRILWVSGPAGSGKTAIMGSLADKCQEDGRLAASFFFSSSSKSSHTRTKYRFVLTLVYQIQQHASLKGHLGQGPAPAIVKDPSILGKHLKEQMEVLLLRPLRDCRGKYDVSVLPKIIVIDGLDECAANQDQGSSHDEHQGPQLTRHRDQEEILSCLLQAANDPAFPFKIIIASRPERTIRNFLLNGPIADPSHISHRFLDDKWDPSKDIDRFLLSQFRQIRREYPHLRSPVHWPGEAIIARLVKAASGQFTYAQAVIRFIRTPSNPPQVQLEYVLGTRCDPGVAPLEYLDALYIKILNSTPNPALTFQWLLAYRWFQRKTGGRTTPREFVTAWFFARFCETMAGEADIIFGDLAALVRIPDHSDVDSQYIFYHKDFLNFLDDPRRSRAFRSHTGDGNFTQKWIVNRFVRSLMCKGPEVPTADPTHLPKFMSQFFKLWNRIVADKEVSALLCQEQVLCRCDAAWWVGHESNLYLYNPTTLRGFWREMCALVHRKCRTYAPCAPPCKLWRDAIVRAGKFDSLLSTNTTTNNDRFFVKLKRLSNMSSLSLRSPVPP